MAEESKSGKSFDEVYDLGAELGRGVFSVVRLGHHKKTRDPYAIKIISKPEMEEFDKKCLKQEIEVLRELKHDHIIRLHDVFGDTGGGGGGGDGDCYNEDNSDCFIHLVLEVVSGGELLDRLIEKSKYTEREARDVCKIVMEAVDYCHEHKIAHRDLKPENLLLTSATDDTTIKIADFGFASHCPHDESLKTQCGSAQHVAPEILHNVPYGTKVDMWALGVIHYTLIGGVPPFYAPTNQATFQRILKAEVVFEDHLWGHVHEDCKDMIRGLLTLDPKKRWSAKEVLDCQWMHDDADELESTSLHVNQQELRAFNAKQKLRATVYALIGLNRLQYNGDMPALDEMSVDSRRTDISVDSRRTEEMSVDPESEEEAVEPEPEEEAVEPEPEEEVVEPEPEPVAEPEPEPEKEPTKTESPPEVEPEPETPYTPATIEPPAPAPEPESVQPREEKAEAPPPPQPQIIISIADDTPANPNSVVTRDVYAAFNLDECSSEPASKAYFALSQKTGEFFESVLKAKHGSSFESVEVSLRKSLFNAGQPSEKYNVYVEWDISVNFSPSAQLPTRRELCRTLVRANLEKYLLEFVRPLESTPFGQVTNCFFGHFAC